jgi:hypothetical protein
MAEIMQKLNKMLQQINPSAELYKQMYQSN